GDATGEMGPFGVATYGSQDRQIGSWYQDEAWFVCPDFVWGIRGGQMSYGSSSGIFHHHSDHGAIVWVTSFRIVLGF
ncbi:MAG: hypothetical protein HFI09_01050, partial [Bacilli bacterium]|nr:hypothetical protein [Bacilli bacterium]